MKLSILYHRGRRFPPMIAAAAIAVSKLGAACSIPSLKEVEDFITALDK
ncbi:sugar/nucleoside kinase (ribokinase family) [Anaerosolibacter carboniphilus]|uniref:Sugar/nucleoside kinase (Ribokinase family) n=1 Tax=Anaerosolibacter carboniphilus TaxID=1417629 RepID=A0A841KZ43_9FIRM|nr:sugar/nucleoside kinase (ribokinase family) [Anaerosolibacter carboniphilus]